MYPYALLVSIILVLQVRIRRKGRRELALLLSFLVLFLFAAMRGNGRGDYFNYLKFASYVTTPEVLWNPSFPTELGFRIIAYIVNQAGLHLQAVIAAMNRLACLDTYRFVREYHPMLCYQLFCSCRSSFSSICMQREQQWRWNQHSHKHVLRGLTANMPW